MHRIDKFLLRLDAQHRAKVLAVLLQISAGNLHDLKLKKLKEVGALYRVRVGRCRVIFEMDDRGIRLLDIDFRNDNTYKKY